MRPVNFVPAVIGLMMLSGTAAAKIGIALKPVPIDPLAISGPGGDPALAQFRTFDIQATYPSGDSFNAAGVYASLTFGRFYAPELGGTFPQSPAVVELLPALEYDTYVTYPDHGTHTGYWTPGRLYGLGAPIMPEFGGQDSLINIVWGRVGQGGPSGTFTIARLTVSEGATGNLDGVLISRAQPNIRWPFGADIVAGEVTNLRVGIPEPASFAIALTALPLLMARRQRGTAGGMAS